jgi:hypothetical protein
MFFPLGKTNAL